MKCSQHFALSQVLQGWCQGEHSQMTRHHCREIWKTAAVQETQTTIPLGPRSFKTGAAGRPSLCPPLPPPLLASSVRCLPMQCVSGRSYSCHYIIVFGSHAEPSLLLTKLQDSFQRTYTAGAIASVWRKTLLMFLKRCVGLTGKDECIYFSQEQLWFVGNSHYDFNSIIPFSRQEWGWSISVFCILSTEQTHSTYLLNKWSKLLSLGT